MTEPLIERHPSHIDLKALARLYEAVGFGLAKSYDPRLLQNALTNSDYIITAIDLPTKKLTGFLRALSDEVSVTWISEIMVDPEHQKTGIGRKMLAILIEDLGHTAIYGEALRGSEEFFTSCQITVKEKLIAVSRAPHILDQT